MAVLLETLLGVLVAVLLGASVLAMWFGLLGGFAGELLERCDRCRRYGLTTGGGLHEEGCPPRLQGGTGHLAHRLGHRLAPRLAPPLDHGLVHRLAMFVHLRGAERQPDGLPRPLALGDAGDQMPIVLAGGGLSLRGDEQTKAGARAADAHAGGLPGLPGLPGLAGDTGTEPVRAGDAEEIYDLRPGLRSDLEVNPV